MRDVNEVKQEVEGRKDLVLPEKNEIVPVDAQALLSQAVEKNLPIETMERLFALRRELKAEQAKDAFFDDLSKFQKECPIIKKNKKVYGKNGKVRFCYAPLADIISQVRDTLERYGFSYVVKTRQEAESVTAICEVHHYQGHHEQTEFRVPVEKDAYMNAAQKVASALTYAKRYAFCDAFGIMTADTDDDSELTGAGYKVTGESNNAFKEQSEDVKEIYRSIMHLINEKHNNYYLFNKKEKIDFKKNADIVITDLDKLTELQGTIIKISADRKLKMDNA
jgi:hypothetical protein